MRICLLQLLCLSRLASLRSAKLLLCVELLEVSLLRLREVRRRAWSAAPGELAELLASFKSILFGVLLSSQIISATQVQLRAAIHMLNLCRAGSSGTHTAAVTMIFASDRNCGYDEASRGAARSHYAGEIYGCSYIKYNTRSRYATGVRCGNRQCFRINLAR